MQVLEKTSKILAVDDNKLNTVLLEEVLSSIGNVVSVYSAMDALKILKTEDIDIILLDVMMPDMEGFELARILKENEKTSNIPIVFVSALSDSVNVMKGLDLGSYGYIKKPYNIQELKATVSNILKIKTLQDELRKESYKLRQILKFSEDGIIMLDKDKKIVECSGIFLDWLDREKEDVIGKLFCEVIDCARKECIMEKMLKQGNKKYEISEERYIKKDGSEKYFQIIFSCMEEPEGFLLVARDITSSKEVEKEKESFIATLTHDLKTPVRAEIRAMELLLKGTFGNLSSEQEDIIKEILYSSRFMFNMINNLLSRFKVDSVGYGLTKTKTDITKVVEDVYNELKYLVNERRHEVFLDFASSEMFVDIDEMEIKRAITNLLANAVAYTEEGGRIVVRVKSSEKYISISVADNGKGILKEDLPIIFHKYKSGAKKFKQIGTGLGLYVTKQIIEAHGGKILVKSKENKGTVFTILLPA